MAADRADAVCPANDQAPIRRLQIGSGGGSIPQSSFVDGSGLGSGHAVNRASVFTVSLTFHTEIGFVS